MSTEAEAKDASQQLTEPFEYLIKCFTKDEEAEFKEARSKFRNKQKMMEAIFCNIYDNGAMKLPPATNLSKKAIIGLVGPLLGSSRITDVLFWSIDPEPKLNDKARDIIRSSRWYALDETLQNGLPWVTKYTAIHEASVSFETIKNNGIEYKVFLLSFSGKGLRQ